MDISNAIAKNAKAIRERKKLTLDSASELTGVSRSMLAQIEKGDVNPTISVLWKIANGYKVSFSSLLEDREGGVDVLRAEDGAVLAEDEGRYRNHPTFSFDEKKGFECYRILMEPAGQLSAQPHMKGAQEYITLFSGQVEIVVDSVSYRLKEGDSIRFFADVPHGYKNLGPGPAAMSMLIYYN